MILADTSVWVDHFRRGSRALSRHLEEGEIAMHSVVLGELATANLGCRVETLAALRRLPRLPEGSSEECLTYLEVHRLFGRGIGWNDVQLLLAAHLSRMPIWSLDRSLMRIADKLDLLYRIA